MKPRKRINPISKRRRTELATYKVVKAMWKILLVSRDEWKCARCGGKPSDSPHHKHGKIHGLLNEMRLFIPLCRNCHIWIDEDRKEARRMGLLAPLGMWNTNPYKNELRTPAH